MSSWPLSVENTMLGYVEKYGYWYDIDSGTSKYHESKGMTPTNSWFCLYKSMPSKQGWQMNMELDMGQQIAYHYQSSKSPFKTVGR